MKVIFLDIDGVLNYVCANAREPGGCIGIADEPLAVLAKIVRQTNAEIVLVSSWKTRWSKDGECGRLGRYLNERLASMGLSILDKTNDNHDNRGYGISRWLDSHPEVKTWLVLDDDFFPDYDTENIRPCLVQTNFYTGRLREEMIPVCLEILNKGE